ncbi:MAG: ABC transporter ATP-binding protein [Thermoplasmata archaeon]|nr:ABC transporter ATP-binding protein [Thermoplasmata archaeon]
MGTAAVEAGGGGNLTGLVLTGVEVQQNGFHLGPVSLAVAPGSVGALIGPNGAGKTTLLRVIAGFGPRPAGELALDGERLNDLPPERRGIGWVPAGLGLLAHRRVEENVRYGLQLRGDPDARAKASSWILRLGLERVAREYPTRLSTGERQRTAIARALAVEPRLLLLDEPTSALDANAREELIRTLRELLAAESIPMLLVAHDAVTAVSLADRVHLLHGGRSRFDGPLAELEDRPVDRFAARFLGYENVLSAEELAAAPSGPLALRLRAASGPGGLAAPAHALIVRPSGPGVEGKLLARRARGRTVLVEIDGLRLLGQAERGSSLPPVGSGVVVEVREEELRGIPGEVGTVADAS